MRTTTKGWKGDVPFKRAWFTPFVPNVKPGVERDHHPPWTDPLRHVEEASDTSSRCVVEFDAMDAPISAKGVWVMDGGVGHQIRNERETNPKEDEHETLVRVHLDFLRAGADVITTHSFVNTPALPPSKQQRNHGERSRSTDGVEHTMRRAGQAAQQAAKRARRQGRTQPVLVAGSLPPTYSCYVPPTDPRDWKDMEMYYQVAVKALLPYADLFLCETMPTSLQAIAAAEQACVTAKPAYVSFTLEDRKETDTPTLRGGETLHDAVATTLHRVPALKGILANCCAPESITGAMPVLAQMVGSRGLSFGGYGNGFWDTTSSWMKKGGHGPIPQEGIAGGNALEPLEMHRHRSDFDEAGIMMPQAYCKHVQKWVAEFGATMVGGCCGTGPLHIRAVRDCVDKHRRSTPGA